MSNRLVDGQSAVDRSHLTFLAGSVTAGATVGAFGRGRSVSGEIAHMLCLDLPAQLLAQFMSSTLDDRIMRDPDGAFHPIKHYETSAASRRSWSSFSLSSVVFPSMG